MLFNGGKQATVQFDAKLQTEATARAHGVPISTLTCDWTSVIEVLKMPCPTCSKLFRKLRRATGRRSDASGVIGQRRLSAEEAKQDEATPDSTRQYGIHLDSKIDRYHEAAAPCQHSP